VLSAGTIISDKYRLDRVIASGGMGVVFAATHLVLGRAVAVKVLRRDVADERKAGSRLLGEARAVANLKGEHVARVLDVGVHDDAPFLVMELLDGSTVFEVVRDHGALTCQRAADLLIQACHGLGEAHKQGIVHRDVKPSNLFLVKGDDGAEQLKVIDFGVSKARPLELSGVGESETTTGTLLGSPSFMSPEQIRSARDVDGRADVWSLGVVLYFMLTTKRPFDAESLLDLMTLIVHEPAPPLSAARPDVPAALAAVVARCLEKTPEKRFATTAELAAALAPLASPAMRALAAKVPVGVVAPPSDDVDLSVPPVSRRASPAAAAAQEEQTAPVVARPGEPSGTLAGSIAAREPPPASAPRRLASKVVTAGVVLGLLAGAAAVAFSSRSARRAEGAAPSSRATPTESTPPPAAPLPSSADTVSAVAAPVTALTSATRVPVAPPPGARTRPRAPPRTPPPPRGTQAPPSKPELPTTPD
jgi:eukaryotic-like serine/threonine-protein kinase